MKPLLSSLLLFQFLLSNAQIKTENLVIVTLDGMRWQEVFGGVDPAIIQNKQFTKDSANIMAQYWSSNINDRRAKLFPFLWNELAKKGQLYGNRIIGNQVNNANPYKFSYPGYNEIFTGYPDVKVNSNEKIWNPNENVLEFINRQKGFEGKVAAFSTWDVIPFILNKQRSGIYVNADRDSLMFPDASLKLINNMQSLTTRPIGVRPDVFTFFAAKEYLKIYKPKVLYISFDETDDFAHAGLYDQYLNSAHAEDAMISDLWQTLQQDPTYRNKTTLIITTDHGRGDLTKENWQHHGEKIPDAGQIWIAVMGPDTKTMGEVIIKQTNYQKQLAATFSALLGLNFTANHPVAEPIKSILAK
ncbi:MAG: phosphoglyceromutase [Chitinophagaceae bacterium BSSC1]|nr:MAG: phosphoglyceromutase [Chitinophagaceae bacterium BSSC1]